MSRFKGFISLAMLVAYGYASKGQTAIEPRLNIGDPLPNLVVSRIINYPGKSLSMVGFRGKLLILDFWSTGCKPCVKMIKDLEPIQKKYKDRLQILPITWEDSTTVMNFFTRLHISAPSVFRDTLIGRLFPHRMIPHYVWVSAEGIIIAITGYLEMTEENLVAAMNGHMPEVIVKDDLKVEEFRQSFNILKGVLPEISDSLINESVYISNLREYDSRIPFGQAFTVNNNAGLLFLNVSIARLYQYAFDIHVNKGEEDFGQTSPNRLFWKVGNYDYYAGNNSHADFYSYNLIYPQKAKDKPALKKMMQKDLNNYFRLKVVSKDSLIPCYVVKCINKAKLLRAKRDTTEHYMPLEIVNSPVADFVELLDKSLLPLPVIDETNVREKVNILIYPDYDLAELRDIKLLNAKLTNYGLQVERAKRILKIVEISDN